MGVKSVEATVEAKKTADSSLTVLQDGPELGPEARKITHTLLEALDTQRRGLEVLHQDLFDSNKELVFSALEVLGKIKDPRSLKFIARLLTRQDEAIRCAAVRAVGGIGHPGATKALFNLFKISKSEPLRCSIMEALSKVSAKNPEVLRLLQEYSTSKLVSVQTQAFATTLLLRPNSGLKVTEILSGAKEEVMQAVYAAAEEDEALAGQVVQHGISHYHRLSAQTRMRLISIASSCSMPESARVLKEGLGDVDPEVRHAAYQALGQSRQQVEYFGELVKQLAERVDPVPTLEEEALGAIERMERCLAGSTRLTLGAKDWLYSQIEELFKVLSTQDRRLGSESHELGWLIVRSKEYLEYYADEDFRQAILHYLKGSSYYDRERMLAALKASAVKVEVRHFEGYRALADIIKNPKRSGVALIARELAIAKLGKREMFYRLVRCLRLTRLFAAASVKVDAVRLFLQIFSWAKQAKLFRLADAALCALAKIDVQKATDAGRECLTPPVFSKICAIAAIHLLKELDWGELEPVVLELLRNCEDPHILLNLIDALSSDGYPVSGEVIKALVQMLHFGEDREILQRAADFLGSQSTSNVLESITAGYEQAEEWRQALVLRIIERKILERRVSNREGLIEFLYKILRGEANTNQPKAAVLLWRLGDDYAVQVLKEFMHTQSTEGKVEILNSLRGALDAEMVPIVLPLLRTENPSMQEALRETLLSTEEESARNKICKLVLSLRGQGSVEDELGEEKEEQVQVDFLAEKKAYRFEREYLQELAILFTDIQGYSKKAQALSTMQLTTLIQEYEGILLPTISSHRGQLIKKMGDGHLFVFASPLDSVLAAIRLQKALKRFNSYREDAQRVIIRVGAHWGKVVHKEGDVLGNHVNIANRLESSAKGGSILISSALFERLDGYIHTREIGLINVKGISDAIKVYEPYEVVIDFPSELDPMKRAKTSAQQTLEQQQTLQAAAAQEVQELENPGNGSFQKKTLSYLAETFSSLNMLCQKAEAKQIQVEEIRKELVKRWNGIKSSFEGEVNK